MIRLALFVFLTAFFLSGCARPEPPQYVGIDQVKVLSVGLSESIVGMDVRMFNPNNSKLQLKSADMEIFVNNSLLGSTQMDSLIQIPKKDTFTVPLLVKVKTLSSATRLLQSLSDSTVMLKVSGTAKFGKGGVFINYPLQYEGRQMIR